MFVAALIVGVTCSSSGNKSIITVKVVSTAELAARTVVSFAFFRVLCELMAICE